MTFVVSTLTSWLNVARVSQLKPLAFLRNLKIVDGKINHMEHFELLHFYYWIHHWVRIKGNTNDVCMQFHINHTDIFLLHFILDIMKQKFQFWSITEISCIPHQYFIHNLVPYIAQQRFFRKCHLYLVGFLFISFL